MTAPSVKLLAFPNAGELTLSIRAKALVFSDPLSQALLRQIERLAPSEATVLITGETGTGKELLARHIHEQSSRHGPFIAVNCGAFSENLVESELFGHESGAFTGAQQARAGWFEAADGGTLFLDEVGDMPLALQVKLLRVLQERQVVRLGSRKPIPVDVRLVAATNVDLERAVDAGNFRHDLYYRLAVAPVALAPLRERRGDILPLVDYFIDVYRRRLGLGTVDVSPQAEQALLGHDWPGNIRELENVVHYALIMCRRQTIDVADLRLSGRPPLPGSGGGIRPTGDEDPLAGLENALACLIGSDRENLHDTVNRLLITQAFSHCQGNQVRTAKRLGISRYTLRADLKRLGLIEPHRETAEQP
ncbi:hypothetical protein OTERR_15820 [Oryzomicrobium terrae]|uniref:Sigma-54 factor interaction domain-containing protein n=1 Tax=Oryzomicrobium terrae TaxID=1735038 RepID=A0A5C1E9W4_9RHOO|nr:sigma-54 dependent transcriptional regulator [Oryzomicrobium terrae]QEL65058.1 hypothetical protein OTERR_15820 [Oryzomicrobium terrae]